MRPAIQLAGKRFGLLVAVSPAASKSSRTTWSCICDCGNICVVSTACLQRGRITCCGCTRSRVACWAYSELVIAAVRDHKARMRKRGLEFSLTHKQMEMLLHSPCHYCGSTAAESSSVNKVNGVDRVDSALGYIPSNCVACCAPCNRAKSSNNLAEFEAWMNRLIKFRMEKIYASTS